MQAVAFGTSPALGMANWIALLAHELPKEWGEFEMLAAGVIAMAVLLMAEQRLGRDPGHLHAPLQPDVKPRSYAPWLPRTSLVVLFFVNEAPGGRVGTEPSSRTECRCGCV